MRAASLRSKCIFQSISIPLIAFLAIDFELILLQLFNNNTNLNRRTMKNNYKFCFVCSYVDIT